MDEIGKLERLRIGGWAPGNYMITCVDCKKVATDCDKRAISCKPCAVKRRGAKTNGTL